MHVRKAVFVIRRLLVSEEKDVTYVCLRCVVSSPSVVRSSPMFVGNNKVVEDEVRWRRSKGVVMNSFYLFRNSKKMPSRRGTNFVACEFIGTEMNCETILW